MICTSRERRVTISHTHTHTHTHTQSEGEPPELEDISDEEELKQEGDGEVLDSNEPAPGTVTLPGTAQTFLTQHTTADDGTPVDGVANHITISGGSTSYLSTGEMATNDVAPDNGATNSVTAKDHSSNDGTPVDLEDTPGDLTTNDSTPIHVTTCGGSLVDLPLIVPRRQTSACQDGLFSVGSARLASEQTTPHSLIIGASPSPKSEDEQRQVSSNWITEKGCGPLIEVVSSKQTSEEQSHSDELEPTIGPCPTEPSTNSLATAPPVSHTHLAQSAQGKDHILKTTEMEGEGQWAFTTSTTELLMPSSKKPPLTGPLLIEEIEDDDFNIGELPLTAAERAAIDETEAALERIRGKDVDELSEGERVWHLAASAGSTLPEREEAELDDKTKSRVLERLEKFGLTDKTSLKF